MLQAINSSKYTLQLKTRRIAVHSRTPTRADAASYTTGPCLNLGQKQRHIVITLLPTLKAEGTAVHLDVEDAVATPQLEEKDECRSQSVEANKGPLAAAEL